MTKQEAIRIIGKARGREASRAMKQMGDTRHLSRDEFNLALAERILANRKA